MAGTGRAEAVVEVVVGVHGDGPGGWQRVLDQERIASRPAGDGAAPVTVFAGALPPWAEQYVRDGGVAVLSGAQPGEPLLPAGTPLSVTGFVPPGSTDRCVAPGLATAFVGPGAGMLRLHEDRVPKYGTDPDTFPVVQVHRHGRGTVVASGVALTSLLAAPGDRLRRFASFSPVTERVAAVDKAVVVDTLLHMLRLGFAEARLPLVVLPRFPAGAPSVLVLRVDVDGVFGEDAMAVSAAAAAGGTAVSYFLNGDLSRRHPGRLGPWDGRTEVGQHAWTHTLFDSVEDNLANLRRAHDWMTESLQHPPRSFVAPRGLWNPALGEALRIMGYRYSSDFGLDFDSLPFRSDSDVLQVPVHPYSPERASVWAREEGLHPPRASEVLTHYLRALSHQVARGRPAHLYGHPEVLGAMAAAVVPALARRAGELGLPSLTLGEYADFWLEREGALPRVTVDRDRGTVHVDVEDVGLPVDVTLAAPGEVQVNGGSRGRVSGRTTVPVGAWSAV